MERATHIQQTSLVKTNFQTQTVALHIHLNGALIWQREGTWDQSHNTLPMTPQLLSLVST